MEFITCSELSAPPCHDIDIPLAAIDAELWNILEQLPSNFDIVDHLDLLLQDGKHDQSKDDDDDNQSTHSNNDQHDEKEKKKSPISKPKTQPVPNPNISKYPRSNKLPEPNDGREYVIAATPPTMDMFGPIESAEFCCLPDDTREKIRDEFFAKHNTINTI